MAGTTTAIGLLGICKGFQLMGVWMPARQHVGGAMAMPMNNFET
jgi:gamma-glutamyl-gamma-aminobutyrate hydrolase PuuD